MLEIRSIDQAVQMLSSGKENETLGCCDLAIDLMTFTLELDLDMVVTYLHAKKLSSKKYENNFGTCDLALDPMNFTSDLDLDMKVTYLHAKN